MHWAFLKEAEEIEMFSIVCLFHSLEDRAWDGNMPQYVWGPVAMS